MEGLFYISRTCERCHHENRLYLQKLTCAYACSKCKNYYTRAGLDEWKTHHPLAGHEFFLALHSKGKIDGVEYIITACLEGKDHEGYDWREYWAYNPQYGYIYFSEFNGHWIRSQEITGEYQKEFKSMDFVEGVYHYKKYSSYRFRYVSFEGELPFVPEMKTLSQKCEEFIAPPFFIACEKDEDSISYSKGQHITVDEVTDIFGKGYTSQPGKVGVGMVEPYKSFMSMPDLVSMSVIAGVMILVLSILYFIMVPERTVYETSFYENPGNDTIVSDVVELHSKQNIQFEIGASIYNNWAGISVDVINIETGDVTSVYGETEYYSGFDGGEGWTEGSQTNDFMISSVPAGKYRFEIVPCGGSGYSNMTIVIRSGVKIYRNLFVALAIILIIPLLFGWLSRNFEVSRWSNSNYSPYDEE